MEVEINHQPEEGEEHESDDEDWPGSSEASFYVIGFGQRDEVVYKKMLRRGQVLGFFANVSPCLVGIEACASAHYWARQLKALGHEVKLIPPQHVKAYVRGNKNDYNDALAIAEAVRSKNRIVCLKRVADDMFDE